MSGVFMLSKEEILETSLSSLTPVDCSNAYLEDELFEYQNDCNLLHENIRNILVDPGLDLREKQIAIADARERGVTYFEMAHPELLEMSLIRSGAKRYMESVHEVNARKIEGLKRLGIVVLKGFKRDLISFMDLNTGEKHDIRTAIIIDDFLISLGLSEDCVDFHAIVGFFYKHDNFRELQKMYLLMVLENA